jgi:hypothetical protein
MASKCGAKTRAGGRCQQPGMPNGRCHFHGGKSTGPKNQKGNQNAFKHGIFAKQWNDEEIEVSRRVQLASLDDEIRLTSVRLHRALKLEAEAQGKPELDEVTNHNLIGREGSARDEKWKVYDYAGLIDRLTARLESLKMKRAELIRRAEEDPADEDKSPIGRIIVEVRHAKPSHDDDRPAS